MCGVVGFIGDREAAPIVLSALAKLEYRGYDSAGVATISDSTVYIKKDIGKLADVCEKHQIEKLPGRVGIGHVRWATHGGVNQNNAHPHVDCTKRIAVVHNGIVDNYREMRQILEGKGHIFTSETDTEVIPHLVEDYLKEGYTLEQAVFVTSQKLKGSYAFITISTQEPGKMVATRRDNPLVIGIGERGTFATSDILSLDGCDKVIFPENGELAILSSDGVAFLDEKGRPIEKKASPRGIKEQNYDKGEYEHFMLKEIMEEPQAIRMATIQDEQSFTQMALDILRARQVIISACGTSRYAALMGR